MTSLGAMQVMLSLAVTVVVPLCWLEAIRLCALIGQQFGLDEGFTNLTAFRENLDSTARLGGISDHLFDTRKAERAANPPHFGISASVDSGKPLVAAFSKCDQKGASPGFCMRPRK